jgi:hypothetical protein
MRENRHGLTSSPFCWCAGVRFAVLQLVLAFAPSASAQTAPGRSQPLITQPIIESNLAVLPGNTRPEAKEAANDRGIVSDGLPLEHMMLQLRRPADRERALVSLIDQLHDRKSPNYQHWLSVGEIGALPSAHEIPVERPRWLADDPVTIGPVCGSNSLPAGNSAGNFADLGPKLVILASIRQANSNAYTGIPYSMKQGIFCAWQGIFPRKQGILTLSGSAARSRLSMLRRSATDRG